MRNTEYWYQPLLSYERVFSSSFCQIRCKNTRKSKRTWLVFNIKLYELAWRLLQHYVVIIKKQIQNIYQTYFVVIHRNIRIKKAIILSPVFFNHNIMAFSVRPLIFRARFSMNEEKSYNMLRITLFILFSSGKKLYFNRVDTITSSYFNITWTRWTRLKITECFIHAQLIETLMDYCQLIMHKELTWWKKFKLNLMEQYKKRLCYLYWLVH